MPFKKSKEQANLNARSRELFLKIGWEVELTQHYNAYSNKSKDFGGFGDLLMWYPGCPDTVVLQVTDHTHRADRKRKLLTNKRAFAWVRGKVSRHLWMHVWERKRLPTKDGAERLIWSPNIIVLTEVDFKRCPGNLSLDAEDLSAQSEPAPRVEDFVRSITRNGLELVGRKNRGRI